MLCVPLPTVCTNFSTLPGFVTPGARVLLKSWLLQWGLQSNLISKSLEQWGPTGPPARCGCFYQCSVVNLREAMSHGPVLRECLAGNHLFTGSSFLIDTLVLLERKTTRNRGSWSNCKGFQPSCLTMKTGPTLHSDGPRITVICEEIQNLLVSLFFSSFWSFLLWKFHMALTGQFPCAGRTC